MKLSYVPFDAFRYADTLHPTQRAELYAALNRINILYMIKRAGSGHIGSSFSALDIITWLYLNELRPEDVFFSSKGHDCPALYATLISLGRLPFDLLHQLRRPGGLPGHPTVDFGPINSGSLGMGISKAKGMILANRLLGKQGRVFVLVGDGELQEGQNWEALRTLEDYPELTVIVDENGMQSDGETLPNPLYNQRLCFNGHDFYEIEKYVKNIGLFVADLFVANTIKGKGVSFMETINEDSLYLYHSGAPSDLDYELALTELTETARSLFPILRLEIVEVETISRQPSPLIQAYSDALVRFGRENDKIVVLDADLMVDCGLKAFRLNFPDRFFECGIAEQDMVSMAGAMARKGFIPFVHSFAAFLTRRALDQIYNNCTEGDKVVYVGSLAGPLGETGPGKSHESLNDMEIMESMMLCWATNSPKGVEDTISFALYGHDGPTYIRLLASGGTQ